MSENNNEQMDVGTGSSDNNNTTDVAADTSTTSPKSSGALTEATMLNLAIKTPKEKKDISVDDSSTVKQVI